MFRCSVPLKIRNKPVRGCWLPRSIWPVPLGKRKLYSMDSWSNPAGLVHSHHLEWNTIQHSAWISHWGISGHLLTCTFFPSSSLQLLPIRLCLPPVSRKQHVRVQKGLRELQVRPVWRELLLRPWELSVQRVSNLLQPCEEGGRILSLPFIACFHQPISPPAS